MGLGTYFGTYASILSECCDSYYDPDCTTYVSLSENYNVGVYILSLLIKLGHCFETISGFSGDNTERSYAAGLPLKPQLLTRMSAGLDCFGHDQDHCQLPAYRVVQGFLEELMQSVTNEGGYGVHAITSLPLLQVRAW